MHIVFLVKFRHKKHVVGFKGGKNVFSVIVGRNSSLVENHVRDPPVNLASILSLFVNNVKSYSCVCSHTDSDVYAGGTLKPAALYPDTDRRCLLHHDEIQRDVTKHRHIRLPTRTS